MKGFEVGERFDTMGLRANDLRRLYFKDVRVPPENVLGEPGEGFRIAMQILNNGRIGLGTGSVGGDQGAARPGDRPRQGAPPVRPSAGRLRARPGQDRLDGLLPVRARVDVLPDLRAGRRGRRRTTRSSRRSARSRGPSSSGTRPTARCSSRAAPATCATEPYEKILRDIRIFPIFEGANDVMRAFIALSGMKPVGEKLSELGEIGLGDPIGSIGVLVDYVGGRIQQRGPPGPDHHGPPGALGPRRRGLRPGQGAPRRHRVAAARAQAAGSSSASSTRSGSPTRVADIYAQIAVLSRVSSIFEDQGVEPSGQERYIADTFCTRAAGRVSAPLRPDRVERRRADVGDRQARLQARRVRLRALRGLRATQPFRSARPRGEECPEARADPHSRDRRSEVAARRAAG